MDPEVIAQLEEQLRQMTDMLVQQNKTMASHVSAIHGATSSYSGFTRSLGSSSHAATKYEEAIRKASEKTTESTASWGHELTKAKERVGTFSQAMTGAATLVGTFAGALLSTEKGFSKYGATVGAASDSVTKLTSAIPLFGTALGAASAVIGGVFTTLVGDGLKLVDAIVNLRDETVKTAGAMPVTSEGLLQLANNAKYFGENIQVLGKITQGLGTGLVTLGTTAGQGAVKFMEMANVTEETRQAFGKMGISQEELTQMQATYIKQQQSSGLAYLSQNKSIDQLRKESLKYAENLNALSGLTGKQADALRAEQDIAAAVMQEKIAQRQDLVELKRLKDNRQFAEAADLEAKMKSMAEYRDAMAGVVGPEQTALYMNYMRTGVYNNISAPLAVMGVDLETARTQLAAGADGMKVATESIDDLTSKQSSMASTLNQAALHMETQALGNVGLLGDSLGRLNDTFGLSAEDRLAAIRKDQEARKNGSPVDNTIEQFRAVERTLQQKYQEVLMEGIKKAAALFNQINLTEVAAKLFDTVLGNVKNGLTVLGVVVGGISAGLAALKIGQWAANSNAEKAQKDFTKALKDSTDALRYSRDASRKAAAADSSEARASGASASADRIEARASDLAKAADSAEARASSASASADRAEAAASRKAASADMREASASQRAASADIREAAESMRAAAADLREARASDAAAAADKRESMSSGGGTLGKAGRFLGRALPWAAGGMAAYDAFSGFNADPNAAFGDKIKNAGSSAINGLTFGLLGSSPLDISEKSANNLQNSQAASGSVESTNQALMEQMSILSSISTTGGVEKLTQEQLAAFGLSNEFGPVVAQEPGTSEKEKAAQAEQAKLSEYTIQKGDTLSKLAEKYGTTVEALMEANKQITNKDLIIEGAQLNIPGKGNMTNEEMLLQMQARMQELAGPEAAQQMWKAIQAGQPISPEMMKMLRTGGIDSSMTSMLANLGSAAQFMGQGQLSGLGLTGVVSGIPGTEVMDPEEIEKVQSDVLRRNREANEEVIQKTKVDNKLLETTIKYDTTLSATAKALQIFRDLIISINSVLGGDGNPTGPGGQNPTVGPGNTTYTGNAGQAADVNSVMAMNLDKESAGGTQLRVRGLGGAGSIGGAYGLSQAARDSAFSSMSADEKQQFTAQTGFSKAPTLNELVNRKGTKFTSDKAKLADQLLAQKFTENTISRLTKRLGRTPTMADIRGAHWLGEAGYVALLDVAKQNPNMTMEAFYGSHPEWTKPDMRQFPNTVGEMISKIAEHAGGGVGAARPSGGNNLLNNFTRFNQGLQDFNQNLAGPSGNTGGLPSNTASNDIVNLGNFLKSSGLRVDGNIHFDGKHPPKGRHSPNGGHYDGTAIDINAPGSVVEAKDNKYGPIFDQIADATRKAGFHTIWRADGHYDHIHIQDRNAKGMPYAEKGGIFKGPDSGYLAMLHGKEAVVPLDNNYTRSKSSEQYTVNGKPVNKKAYDSFMKDNPELQNMQQKVQSMMSTIKNDKLDPSKMIGSLSRLMDSNLTGVKDQMIDKNSKIQNSLLQMVSRETNKAIEAINETNQPIQNAANSITNSMRTVMKAHTDSMNELTYRLGQMVDVLEAGNEVSKKILKKASA
jgi:LysM repeat protein/uncharacterized protein YjlB